MDKPDVKRQILFRATEVSRLSFNRSQSVRGDDNGVVRQGLDGFESDQGLMQTVLSQETSEASLLQ